MTAITKPEAKGAALAKAPIEVQQQLEVRRIQNAVAAEIANLSWGQNIGRTTARAIAEWGYQHRVDVITEVDVLGGRLYLNARFYLRKLADLIAEGRIEYATADHINEDKRLDTWPEERERRLRERITHQVPDDAGGACVFRIKLAGMAKEITGVEWCGGANGGQDPVGKAEPAKTSETRAARRAMRLLTSHVPALGHEVESVEIAAANIEPMIEEDAQQIAPSKRLTPVNVPADPYASEAAIEQGDAFEGAS